MLQLNSGRMSRMLLTRFLPAMAAIVAVTAAAAYACTNLSTLNLSGGSGAPGTTFTATGSSFSPNAPVILHWNSPTGSVIAKVNASPVGSIAASAKVPAGTAPGEYTVVATQMVQGAPAFGTPARAAFQVAGPGGATASASQNSAPTSNPLASVGSSGSGVSGGLLAVTIILAVLGMSLFGFGAAGYIRQRRKAEAPVPAPTKK